MPGSTGKRLIPITNHALSSIQFRYANISYKLRQKSKGGVRWASCSKPKGQNEMKTEEPPKMIVLLAGTSFTTIVEEPKTFNFNSPCS